MFDDLKNVAASSQPSSPPPVTKTGPVDDMFGDVDPAPKISPAVFGVDKPSAVQSGKIKPISANNVPQAKAQAPVSAPMPMAKDQLMMEEEEIHGSKKFIIAGAVILLVLILAGVVYFIVKRSNNNQINQEFNQNVNNNVNQVVNTVNDTNDNIDENVLIDEADDDFDGLPNSEELKLGTNIYESDSDNDGVFDQDEVQIYKTNPLSDDSDSDNLNDYQEIFIWQTDPNKADSDGDGFADGLEVKNGYNPLGRGLIEDAPPGTFNLDGNLNINQPATSTIQNNNQ